MNQNMKCKICCSTDGIVVGKPRINQNFPNINSHDYSIVKCNHCKFYYVTPKISLTQKEWSKLYKNDYFLSHNVTAWQQSMFQKERKTRINQILKNLGSERETFLDIGCGEGFVLNEAISNGFTTYGVDIADNRRDFVINRKINFFEGNIFDAHYQDNFFSVIYMDSVMEHVDDPISLLKEIFRILKPKGIGFLVVPNEDSLDNDFKKLLYYLTFKKNLYGRIKPFVPPYHINGFNPHSLQYAIESAELKVIKLSQFSGSYQFWKAYKPFSKGYFRSLILYPSGLLSILMNKQNQLQVIFTK